MNSIEPALYDPVRTLIVLALPFIGAIFAPFIVRSSRSLAPWVLALIPAFNFYSFAQLIPSIAQGERVTGGYVWLRAFNVNFSWHIDGLALVFALLITGIGTAVILYAGGYLKGHQQLGRFFSFLLMFMGAMQGLVIADNFITLFVFWELTSITSFLLIGFNHHREASRRAALQALVVTGLGGLSLLAGLLLIWNISGVNELSLLLTTGSIVTDSPFYLAALVLVLGGAFTKSAQFPFHFWLPNAMEAPTPVSAYLHSATMVKAGVYLLMRLNPVMGDSALWQTILPLFGGVTLVFGAILALRQTDLKLTLAYTTVASLGLLVMLTGFGSEKAVEAAVLYLIGHSLFKGALFMIAGVIDHGTGTRDVTKLGGLRAVMPVTFIAAVAAAMSMGGLPPFFGFLAKEEIYAALENPQIWTIFILLCAICGNALMFAAGFVVALKPFLGARKETPHAPHEGGVLLLFGPIVLAILGCLMAVFSSTTHHYLTNGVASAIVGSGVELHISLVPHFGIPLMLSGLTIAIGIVLYLFVDRFRSSIAKLLQWIGWGPDRGFDQFISGLIKLAVRITRFVQPGKLEIYMTATFLVLGLVLIVPMVLYSELPHLPHWPQMRFYEWTIMGLAIIGLGAIIFAKDRLTAIVCLGIQGFAVALLFMIFGAPDLSFTQFMVETLSVVILALVMTRLHLSAADHRPRTEQIIDFSVASLCGAGFYLVLLKVTQVPFNNELTEFFNANSKVIAHGSNIVNVIIVDFRGLDTLGEIAVVMVTGLAILALIRVKKPGLKSTNKQVTIENEKGAA